MKTYWLADSFASSFPLSVFNHSSLPLNPLKESASSTTNDAGSASRAKVGDQ